MRFLSLVIPVYHPPRRFLEELINSIASQIRSDVEVILSVDGPLRAQDEWVRPLGRRHHWITVLEGAVDDRHGISATTNRGVVVASGDYVAFVDQDDLLIDGCLDTYCEFLRNNPSIDIAYCDEQTIDENGAVQTVFRKPDWNPTRLECQNYICHMLTVRRTVFHNLGNYRSEFDYAQDWDLCLRAMDAGARFDHIRKVLYGWRAHGSSTWLEIENAASSFRQSAMA